MAGRIADGPADDRPPGRLRRNDHRDPPTLAEVAKEPLRVGKLGQIIPPTPLGRAPVTNTTARFDPAAHANLGLAKLRRILIVAGLAVAFRIPASIDGLSC